MSPREQLTAIQDREREKIAKVGTAAATRVGVNARAAALRAYRTGGDVLGSIRQAIRPMQPLLVKAMVAGHLRGELRTLANTPETRARVRFDRLDDVIRPLAEKLTVNPARKAQLEATFNLPAGEMVNRATGDIVEKVRAAIEQAQAEGLHAGDGMNLIREAFKNAGVTNAANFQLETLYRTGTALGYAAGRWAKGQEPEIAEILWGYEYVTAGDDRVRPSHAALDGLRMPKDDPRWRVSMPPIPSSPWNCRCDVIEVFHDDPGLDSVSIPDGAFTGLLAEDGQPIGSALRWAV